jgi:hypothetical protein
VPIAVEQAVLRCLDKDPNARFANVAEMAGALAPFGTQFARTSYESIERVATGVARTSELPLWPPLAPDDTALERWPSDARADVRTFASPASPKTVLGSFLMLAGLGVAALMWMDSNVHGDEPRSSGVTAAEPNVRAGTAPFAPFASASSTLPSTPPSTDPSEGEPTPPERAAFPAPPPVQGTKIRVPPRQHARASPAPSEARQREGSPLELESSRGARGRDEEPAAPPAAPTDDLFEGRK